MNPHYWAISCAARRRSSAPKQIPEPMETVVLEKPAPQSGMFLITSWVCLKKWGNPLVKMAITWGIYCMFTHTHPRMIGSWFLRCPMVRSKFTVLSAFCTWILCHDIAGPSSRLVPCWLWVLERLGSTFCMLTSRVAGCYTVLAGGRWIDWEHGWVSPVPTESQVWGPYFVNPMSDCSNGEHCPQPFCTWTIETRLVQRLLVRTCVEEIVQHSTSWAQSGGATVEWGCWLRFSHCWEWAQAMIPGRRVEVHWHWGSHPVAWAYGPGSDMEPWIWIQSSKRKNIWCNICERGT